MIIGIAFIILIIVVLALMLTSYDAGKKYAEQKINSCHKNVGTFTFTNHF